MQLQVNDTIFHNWKIKKIIGEGSFGTVYEIEREEFGRIYRAAAKVISIPKNKSDYMDILDEGMTEENVTEYYRSLVDDIIGECDLMERMKGDSHIVSYEDHHVEMADNGMSWTIYIRMELLKPLVACIKENSLTQKDVIQLGIDICRGLETCQKFKVIHRDIKPENIFVSDTHNYKLGDFGISKVMERSEMAVSKKGTQMYMAPEVYRGEQYDTTVDIYSLGIVLFRLMNNNRTPFLPPFPTPIRFQDKEAALQKRLTGEQIPKPCNASQKFVEIIQKACSYRAEDRYQKPYEMRKVLETILDEEIKIEDITLLEEKTDENDKTLGVFNSDRNWSVTEEEKRRAEEKKRLEEEVRRKAEEARKKAEEEAKQKEEERQRAEEEARQKAEEEARRKAEEEARQKAEEEARRKAEEEARQKAEEEARRKAEEEAKQKAEEEARRKAEEEAKQKAEEETRRKAEEERKRKVDEECRRKAEEKARQIAARVMEKEAEKERRTEEAKQKKEDLSKSNLIKLNTYSNSEPDFLEMEPFIQTSVKKEVNEKNVSKKDSGNTIQRQQSDYRTANRNKSKVPFIITGIVVIICGVGIVIAGAFTRVPDIGGMSLENAEMTLKKAKLSLGTTEYDFSDTVPVDCIILQEKESGSHTKKHTSVDVVISKGVPIIQMPDMVNIGQEEAQNNLNTFDLDLIIDVQPVYSTTIEAGRICGQVPEVNTELKKGDTVILYLSQGSGTMPNVIGMSLEDATNTLKAFGIVLNTSEVFHATVPAGQVASQSIAEGEAVGYGMELSLEISKGAEMLTVPKVTGLSEADAMAKLIEAGFTKEQIQISYEYNNEIAKGNVISQDIEADSQTEKGNVIHLSVSQGKQTVTTNKASGGSNNSNKKNNNNSGWNWEEID